MFILLFNVLLLVHVFCVGICLSHVLIIFYTWDFFIMGFIFKIVSSFFCTCMNCLLQKTYHQCPYKKKSIYWDTSIPTIVLASSVKILFIYVVHQYIKFSLNHTLVPHTLIFFHLTFPLESKTLTSSTFIKLRLWVHLSPSYFSQWFIPKLDPHPLYTY